MMSFISDVKGRQMEVERLLRAQEGVAEFLLHVFLGHQKAM